MDYTPDHFLIGSKFDRTYSSEGGSKFDRGVMGDDQNLIVKGSFFDRGVQR